MSRVVRVGRDLYALPEGLSLARIKRAAVAGGLSWRSIAARPSTALDVVSRIEAVRARLDLGERTPETIRMADRLGLDSEPIE